MSLVIKVLGAGQHVGKSANVVHLNNVSVLIDCGIQITKEGPNRFPDLSSLFTPIPGLARDAATSERRPTKRLKRETVVESSRQPKDNPRYLSQTPLSPTLSSNFYCTIDAVLITHCHLDHIGALPHFTEVLKYQGHIFMTEATLTLARLLLNDCWSSKHFRSSCFSSSIRNTPLDIDREESPELANSSDEAGSFNSSGRIPSRGGGSSFFGNVPITTQMIESCLSRVTTVPFNTRIPIGSSTVSFTAFPAGHVIGACMFLVEDCSTGQSVLYTGDITTGCERLIKPATIPHLRPAVVISESTYGGQVRDSKKATEQDLCNAAEEVLRRGGKVLIPISGVGKAQEIAALLSRHWDKNGLTVPILLGTGMIDSGFELLKSLSSGDVNWSSLSHIRPANVNTVLSEYPSSPVVYFSPPKTLSAGASLKVLKVWAKDPNNMILLPSFSVPGTVAYQVLQGQRRLVIPNQTEPIELKASMRYFSLGSHADSIEIQTFFKHVEPLLSILVHGEVSGMKCLSANLRELLHRPVCSPVNNEVVVVQLPGIRALPSSFSKLYYHAANQAILAKHSNKISLKSLVYRNFNFVENWLGHQRKTLSQSELETDQLDELIAEWCPNVTPLLEVLVGVGPDSDALKTSLLKMVDAELPWTVDETGVRKPEKTTKVERRSPLKKRVKGAQVLSRKRKAVPSLGALSPKFQGETSDVEEIEEGEIS